jgi:hypothetical protein
MSGGLGENTISEIIRKPNKLAESTSIWIEDELKRDIYK